MSDLRTVLTGIVFGESTRWHEGRVWFADWAKQEIIAVTDPGVGEATAEIVVRGPDSGFGPSCIDWLPDGRLLLVSGRHRALLRREADGEIVPHADLSATFADEHWNEVACDARGYAYVNNIGFAFPGGEFVPGVIAVVTPQGSARLVADGLAFPNGMAITADGSTLIVAESYAHRLTAYDIEADGGLARRRVWADLGEAAYPDGICVDAEGAVWYADVPNRRCVRVAEGGQVLQTIASPLGCFSCAVGGSDHPTLYMVAADFSDPAAMFTADPTGVLFAADVTVPGVGVRD